MDGASSTADAASGPMPPPGGGLPPTQEDFVYDAGMAHATVAFGAIMAAITTASVVVRLYTRYFITKQVRVDDAWALCALLSLIGVNILQSLFLEEYLPSMKAMIVEGNGGSRIPYATTITYNISMACLKMTFLFQFYHIFRHVRVMKTVYMIAILVVGAWSLTQILLGVFVCVPVEANWSLNVANVRCLPPVVSTYVNSTGTILTDVIVLFLPLPTLWSLRLRGRQIWAVFGVFGIGAVVPLISAGRIHSLTSPPPKGYMSTACWTIAELGVGITTASLATIRYLFDRRVTVILSSHHQSARRDSVSAGTAPDAPAKPFTRQPTGSQVDLIRHSQAGTASSLGGGFNLFGKKKGPEAWTAGVPSDLTGNEGTTRTNITSSRDKNMPMSQGAANFLGEFGILVEKTWVVEEIRMT
ncbi:integral membrane protein [Colletotrichum musicola]|uniref:Integral membrane protein n=1 Tax=Colletotrichum musicola TaxID=2175873 RepID=A0A8H6NPI4_9PEZI|nr:integral membrane protein [Colletotrichum musicola]